MEPLRLDFSHAHPRAGGDKIEGVLPEVTLPNCHFSITAGVLFVRRIVAKYGGI